MSELVGRTPAQIAGAEIALQGIKTVDLPGFATDIKDTTRRWRRNLGSRVEQLVAENNFPRYPVMRKDATGKRGVGAEPVMLINLGAGALTPDYYFAPGESVGKNGERYTTGEIYTTEVVNIGSKKNPRYVPDWDTREAVPDRDYLFLAFQAREVLEERLGDLVQQDREIARETGVFQAQAVQGQESTEA